MEYSNGDGKKNGNGKHDEARSFHPGMGQAVAERTILRKVDPATGTDVPPAEVASGAEYRWETWEDVCRRVSLGNSLLAPDDHRERERVQLFEHMKKGVVIMSGRHLQHGDEKQPSRPLEVFSNCSTSAASFLTFLLLMSGSGVGRCYDDDMIFVDWDNAPNLRCVLSEDHPDFDWSAHESTRAARHKYRGRKSVWHEVDDSREGWAKAVELYEVMAFEKINREKTLVLDFSKVRAKGSPIMGMQGRPASGPVPLMNAMNKIASLKGCGLSPWAQTLYVDHYLGECVLVGGVRRAARMSTKHWKDPEILDFVRIKRPIEFEGKKMEEVVEIRQERSRSRKPPLMSYLWSSNNSVAVDEEFWSLLALPRGHDDYWSKPAKQARKVEKAVLEAAYGDGTGEPGLINVDKLVQKNEGLTTLLRGEFVGSSRYQVEDDTKIFLSKIAKTAAKKKHNMITNPSLRAGTRVMTEDGIRKIEDLDGKEFRVRNLKGEYASARCWMSGRDKELFKITLLGGHSYYATAEHKWPILKDDNWIRVATNEVVPGDYLPIIKTDSLGYGTSGSYDDGFLLGWNLGDGWITERSDDGRYQYGFIFSEEDRGFGIAERLGRSLADRGWSGSIGTKTEINVSCAGVRSFFSEMNMVHKNGGLPLFVFEKASENFRRGLIDALFSSDGSVSSKAIIFTTVYEKLAQDVSDLLGFYGIKTNINITESDDIAIFGRPPKVYKTRYDVKVTNWPSIEHFHRVFTLTHGRKQGRIADIVNTYDGRRMTEGRIRVISVEKTALKEDVWDISVDDDTRCFQLAHCVTGNCGEIALSVFGGYCVIADTVPFHADTIDEFVDACKTTARALIRCNLMESTYGPEVKRTNRIGVGITGIHEFAWKFWKVGFRDLVDPDFVGWKDYNDVYLRSMDDPAPTGLRPPRISSNPRIRAADFWATLAMVSRETTQEAIRYSVELGLTTPHTTITTKPSGSVSKLFGLCEGWHLPSMSHYLRWVQFRNEDPLVGDYESRGYPTKRLKHYEGTTVVGFPTSPTISELGMGDKMVLAGEATPEEQFKWLMLGERFWLEGIDPLDERRFDVTDPFGPRKNYDMTEDHANQISFTLKYNPSKVSYDEFSNMMKTWMSRIRCCSVMPQEDASAAAYEYLPEEPVTKARFEEIAREISETIVEDVDFEHVDCGSGACPIDFRR